MDKKKSGKVKAEMQKERAREREKVERYEAAN